MLDIRTAMRRAAQMNYNEVAVESGGRQFSFGEMWRRGLQMAQALLSFNLQPGDRVGVLDDNGVEAVDFLLGAAAANLVRVPLYTRNARDAHKHMLQTTGCRVLFVPEHRLQEVEGLDEELGLRLLVRRADYESWLALQSDTDPDPPVALDDTFIIRHTGGVDGLPKGVAYSHRAWTSTFRDWFYMLPPPGLGDRCLHVAPISHASGYLFLPMWLAGACNVLEPSFNATRTLAQIEGRDVSYFFLVSSMLTELIRQAGERPLVAPRLKAIVATSATIDRRTAIAAQRVFGSRLFQLYGQTEAMPITCMGPQEWFGRMEGSDPLLSAGRVLPFVELEIRDRNNRRVDVDTAGEIAVRREGQMEALWGDPETTARRLLDGWVLTGDIGKLDRNGYLYLLGHRNGMITSGGFHIWPAELENVISALAGVREVSVFATPDPKWGETPMAVVVVGDDGPSEADVIEACRSRLGSYKKPSQVILRTQSLPRNTDGKVDVAALQKSYGAGQEGRIGSV